MKQTIEKNVKIYAIILIFIGTSMMPLAGGIPTLSQKTRVDDYLDQENSNWNGAGTGYDGNVTIAQSFIPTVDTITRVELIVWNTGDPHGTLTVSIRQNLNESDLTAVTLPVEVIPQEFYPDVIWTEFDFPDINITANTTYFIIWALNIEENPGPMPYNNTNWGATQDDNYTNGEQWYNIGDSWHNVSPGWDFCFKTYGNVSIDGFILLFGLIIADAKINLVEKSNNSFFRYFYFSENVQKVTVIGYGSMVHDDDPILHSRFMMKTFTNITALAGEIHREMYVSDEYQHFTAVGTFFHPAIILFTS